MCDTLLDLQNRLEDRPALKSVARKTYKSASGRKGTSQSVQKRCCSALLPVEGAETLTRCA